MSNWNGVPTQVSPELFERARKIFLKTPLYRLGILAAKGEK